MTKKLCQMTEKYRTRRCLFIEGEHYKNQSFKAEKASVGPTNASFNKTLWLKFDMWQKFVTIMPFFMVNVGKCSACKVFHSQSSNVCAVIRPCCRFTVIHSSGWHHQASYFLSLFKRGKKKFNSKPVTSISYPLYALYMPRSSSHDKKRLTHKSLKILSLRRFWSDEYEAGPSSRSHVKNPGKFRLNTFIHPPLFICMRSDWQTHCWVITVWWTFIVFRLVETETCCALACCTNANLFHVDIISYCSLSNHSTSLTFFAR